LTAAAAALLLLSACGSSAGVGGVTASEADRLNAAAATLDAQSSTTRSPEPDVSLNPAAVVARDSNRNRTTNSIDNAATTRP
jgi:ABC-type enterochelin transport system substrate-binding protein